MQPTYRRLGRGLVLAVAACAAAARPAAAVDGVIEINQARALAGGVTATDTAGFPVTIDASGSYRLTGNLTVDQNTTAIRVEATATEVTIDLNGFSILGPVSCTNASPPSCTPVGTGTGISGLGSFNTRIHVFNGVIRGLGNAGIVTGGAIAIEGVRLTSNRVNGLVAGDYSTVDHVTAERNGAAGIHVQTNSIVRSSSAVQNGSIGIYVGGVSVIEYCTAYINFATGIFVGSGSTITGNTSSSNHGDGILADFNSTVVDNASSYNTGYGLSVSNPTFGTTGYARNVFAANNGGNANPQVFGGFEIGTNICGTDTVCP